MKHLLSAGCMTTLALSLHAQLIEGPLSLDGINDYAEIAVPIIPDSSDFTIEFLFDFCNYAGVPAYLFDSRGSTAGNGIQLRLDGDSLFHIEMQGSGGFMQAYNNTFTASLLKNSWNHLAITHSEPDSVTTVFLNGMPVHLFAHTMITFPKLTIGKADYTTAGYFDGQFDEFRISDQVRYTGPFVPPITEHLTDSATVALWHFNEGSGATLFMDSSSNAYSLTGYAGAHTNIAFISTPDLYLCLGDSGYMGAGGGTFFSWTPSAGLSDTTSYYISAKPAVTTTYTVTVSDSNSCSDSIMTITVFVTNPPAVSAGPDTAICQGTCVQLNGSVSAGSVLWYDNVMNGTFIPDDTTVNAQYCPHPDSAGVIILSLYAYSGYYGECTRIDTLILTVTTCAGIEKIGGKMPLFIYPNPSTDIIRVTGLDMNGRVMIYDICGRHVLDGHLKDASISIGNLPKGLYELRGQRQDGDQAGVRFMKE